MTTTAYTTRTSMAKNLLRKKILSMKENSKIPGEFELCDKLGVSRGTVRDAISMLVSEGLLEKRHGVGTFVKKTVKEKTRTIIVVRRKPEIVPRFSLEHRMTEHYFEKYISVLSESCLKRKAIYSIILWKSMIFFEKQLEAISEASYLEGVILSDELDFQQRQEIQAYLDSSGIRYCSIDPLDIPIQQFSISVCQESGISKGLTYLWNLGHRRIAFIGVPVHRAGPNCGREIGRYSAFLNFFRRKNISREELLIAEDNSDYNTTYAKVRELLSMPNPPSAIFCQNDVRGIITLEVCRKMGIRVPEDLSIIGFDNNPEAELVTPPISTVDLCVEERVEMAAKYLYGEIPEKDFPLLVESKFIKRESTGKSRS